jgi:YesN/AraC family two-component response regulator
MSTEFQEWISLILLAAGLFAYVAYLGIIVPKIVPEVFSDFVYHLSSAKEKRYKSIDSFTHLMVCTLDSMGFVVIFGLVVAPFAIFVF